MTGHDRLAGGGRSGCAVPLGQRQVTTGKVAVIEQADGM